MFWRWRTRSLSPPSRSNPPDARRARLRGFEALEDRTVPAGSLVAAADAGAPPEVRVFDGTSGAIRAQFLAYDGSTLSGVRVASGDVTGDGFDDLVTVPGPNSAPHVKVFDGQTGALVGSFFAYSTAVTAGVFVAVGDIDGDGVGEIITSLGGGAAPHVQAFRTDGSVIASFFAYTPAFTGGVRVASGDVNGDGFDEIVTGVGFGGGPHVQAFDLSSGSPVGITSFFAYAPNVSTGVFVASGDINGDGFDEIITGAGAGGGPHVQAFDQNGGSTASFFAFAPAFAGGVRVSAADVNGDGVAEIIASPGYGAQPIVTAFNAGGGTVTSFFSFPADIQVGTYVTGSATPLNLLSSSSEEIQAAYAALAARVQANRPVIIIQQNNNFLAPYPFGVFGFGFGATFPLYYDAPGLFYAPDYFYGDTFFIDQGFVDPGFVDPGFYYDPYYYDPYYYDPYYYDDSFYYDYGYDYGGYGGDFYY